MEKMELFQLGVVGYPNGFSFLRNAAPNMFSNKKIRVNSIMPILVTTNLSLPA